MIQTCSLDVLSSDMNQAVILREVDTGQGPLRAFVVPPQDSGLPTVVSLHGVARDPLAHLSALAPGALQSGFGLVVPYFEERAWPVFQRIERRRRPDLALISLFDGLGVGAVRLFGFSGGAQLAHRFAMAYPNRIAALHLGAAGWYTLPDAGTAYPVGLAGAGPCAAMRANLDHFRAIPVTVWCGSKDTERDARLRISATLDALQGPHRLARAASYVAALKAFGMRAEFHEIPGVAHDAADCINRGEIADHLFAV